MIIEKLMMMIVIVVIIVVRQHTHLHVIIIAIMTSNTINSDTEHTCHQIIAVFALPVK